MTKAQAKRRLVEANDKIAKVWLANYSDNKNSLLTTQQQKKLQSAMHDVMLVIERM
jgi:aminopeptidase-like protein